MCSPRYTLSCCCQTSLMSCRDSMTSYTQSTNEIYFWKRNAQRDWSLVLRRSKRHLLVFPVDMAASGLSSSSSNFIGSVDARSRNPDADPAGKTGRDSAKLMWLITSIVFLCSCCYGQKRKTKNNQAKTSVRCHVRSDVVQRMTGFYGSAPKLNIV